MVEPALLRGDEAKQRSPEELFADLASSHQGLSRAEAEARLARFGPNALEEKRVNPILKFLRFFWGPIPWMIEVAAVLSAIVRTSFWHITGVNELFNPTEVHKPMESPEPL